MNDVEGEGHVADKNVAHRDEENDESECDRVGDGHSCH